MAASPSQAPFGNEEDNWFGRDDREAESRAEQSVAAVGARIIGAKPFPVAARRLEELTRNPKARLEQVVSVLETDPGLSVRLLRLVNSAGYGLKVRVTSVRHAAVLVGTRRLHQVATTAAILDMFETSNAIAVQLLEHAAVVGSLCRYLAVHLGLPHDELFTCGFLHDIGKLMLLDTEGEKYADLVRQHGNAADELHLHERKMLGFDHAVLGAHVLSAWNIPEPIPKVVAFHHQPARAMQDTLLASMVHTLRVADMLSYALDLHTDDVGISVVTESEAAQYLEISEPQMAAMWSDLRALADRSRARSHGQPDMEVVAPRRLEVPRSLRPRRSGAPRSLRPSDTPSASLLLAGAGRALEKSKSSGSSSEPNRAHDVNEMPAHFPCVACSKPSFGNVCAACRGQVCPEHQIGLEHWCVLCVREHEKFVDQNRVPGYLKVSGLALACFSVGASITGVMVSQTFAVWKVIVAPLTILLLWGVLLPVAHRLWLRRRFLGTRPKGRVPAPLTLPRPNPVFISSLDANLETDGLIGPSLHPPSQASPAAEATKTAETTAEAAPSDASCAGLPKVEGEDAALASEPAAIDVSQVDAAALDLAAAALERSDEALLAVDPALAVAVGSSSSVPAGQGSLPSERDSVEAGLSSHGSLPIAAAAFSNVAISTVAVPTGLSEFPSVSSASELEQVVAAVSARLVSDAPSNDYTGPSADLRFASLSPTPAAEVRADPAAPAPADDAVPPRAAPSAPAVDDEVAEATGAIASASEAASRPLDTSSLVAPTSAETTALPLATPALALLVFPRVNLNHGCAPRLGFKCDLPIAGNCTAAPRRASIRPPREFAVSEGPPLTLRGLG